MRPISIPLAELQQPGQRGRGLREPSRRGRRGLPAASATGAWWLARVVRQPGAGGPERDQRRQQDAPCEPGRLDAPRSIRCMRRAASPVSDHVHAKSRLSHAGGHGRAPRHPGRAGCNGRRRSRGSGRISTHRPTPPAHTAAPPAPRRVPPETLLVHHAEGHHRTGKTVAGGTPEPRGGLRPRPW